ncbi:MAG: thiamine pyrophosphate-dependent dehydrogenase E1 component subunit alpha [Actinobacteria bacterium]|nr:thiamine pyrophosphate-dependent dehydrogenase E1 component subunit alpha [Actinomycetota bacterium]
MNISAELKLEIYKTLLLIRESELKMVMLYKKGELPGHVLPCLGQEAIPAGFSKALRSEDIVVTGHRGAGHYIARGGDLKKLWAELYGRKNGILGGKGGQMHLVDMNVNTIAGNAIVGANWVLGCGAGFAAKQNKENQVAAVFGGEASTNRGTFHEALNMAALKKLPVVFTVEFNGKQLWDNNDYVTAVKDLADRAKAHDIPGINCDGNDPESVYAAAAEMVQRARNGQGPSLIVAKTFKWIDSGANQRQTDAEMEEGKSKYDPVKLYTKKLLEEAILDEKLVKELTRNTSEIIGQAIEFGFNSPLPSAKDAYTNVYV